MENVLVKGFMLKQRKSKRTWVFQGSIGKLTQFFSGQCNRERVDQIAKVVFKACVMLVES